MTVGACAHDASSRPSFSSLPVIPKIRRGPAHPPKIVASRPSPASRWACPAGERAGHRRQARRRGMGRRCRARAARQSDHRGPGAVVAGGGLGADRLRRRARCGSASSCAIARRWRRSGATTCDPHVWGKSSGVELMLQPGDPGDNRDYYELQVDVGGAVFDSHFDDYNAPIERRRRGARSSGTRTGRAASSARAFVQRGSFWSVELALPWRAHRRRARDGAAASRATSGGSTCTASATGSATRSPGRRCAARATSIARRALDACASTSAHLERRGLNRSEKGQRAGWAARLAESTCRTP